MRRDHLVSVPVPDADPDGIARLGTIALKGQLRHAGHVVTNRRVNQDNAAQRRCLDGDGQGYLDGIASRISNGDIDLVAAVLQRVGQDVLPLAMTINHRRTTAAVGADQPDNGARLPGAGQGWPVGTNKVVIRSRFGVKAGRESIHLTVNHHHAGNRVITATACGIDGGDHELVGPRQHRIGGDQMEGTVGAGHHRLGQIQRDDAQGDFSVGCGPATEHQRLTAGNAGTG